MNRRQRRLIRVGRLIDGTGREPLSDQAIRVEAGRIQAITPWPGGHDDAEILDLSPFTVLPGFIDTHLHITLDPGNPESPYDPEQDPAEIVLRAVGNAQAALRAGVTTIGDCGAENRIIFPLREAINRGGLIGPRILASGQAIVPQGGHGAEYFGRTAQGVDQVRKAVREQVKAGADFIKVMATGGGGEDPGACHFDVAELTAIREEAHQYGKLVAAHAHGTEGIRNCVEAGIQRIEHCTFFNGDGFDFDADIARAIAAKGVIVSPTNVIDYRRIQQGGQGAPREELNHVWRRLLAHGVRFAASSDAGVTDIVYDDYALIWELMVEELGMSPMDAVSAGTSVAAEALGLAEELGTLTAGKQADLVAVTGNPLEGVGAIRQVQLVMRSGNMVHSSAN